MTEVEIITIGDELLIGQVVDTNSAWMATTLNNSGFDVRFKSTVGDIAADIADAIDRAMRRASIVLLTGGIGPTNDDITKQTLCDFFHTRLVFDPATLKNIEDVSGANRRVLNEITRTQAFVPEDCTVIQNRVGTAPITWFCRDGHILVSMPGVPYEMKWAMENEIIPRLQAFFVERVTIVHRSFWVKNYTESMLARKLTRFEENLSKYVKLAYLPTSGIIRLRLTGKSFDKLEVNCAVAQASDALIALLADDIVSVADDGLEYALHRVLIERNLTLSLAESCTGGALSALFTAIPGCSQYYRGGAVVYSNDAKINVLGVSHSAIEQNGAVSREVVIEMAAGARRVFGSDCSIAVSGIAGPDGGTADKPIGTVWIAVSCDNKCVAQEFHFTRVREANILRACTNGIRMLLEII
ncbi:MAG: CinA family nicotinamide mononucleotide deamidase-related protein [Tannerella sp.]|jgi:nicotinamide-nucleotide amidase|nr:CinA family nicotinamide mononucleotide deamidase-related protein [Tannerella sp.]